MTQMPLSPKKLDAINSLLFLSSLSLSFCARATSPCNNNKTRSL